MKMSLIFTMVADFVVCEVRADVEETLDWLEITEAHTGCAMHELNPAKQLTIYR